MDLSGAASIQEVRKLNSFHLNGYFSHNHQKKSGNFNGIVLYKRISKNYTLIPSRLHLLTSKFDIL